MGPIERDKNVLFLQANRNARVRRAICPLSQGVLSEQQKAEEVSSRLAYKSFGSVGQTALNFIISAPFSQINPNT